MRGHTGIAALVGFLLLSPGALAGTAGHPPPAPTTGDPTLKVGSLDEMKTRNPLPAIASDPWTRSVLDRVYDTVLLRDPGTEEPIAYIAKGVDADEDGLFATTEYDLWKERANATTPLAITVYYDFNGVRWHDGSQMDVWDLLFSYHVNAMNPIWNSALRVLFAGGPGVTYEGSGRRLSVSLAVKNWEAEGTLAGDATLRVAVSFLLNEPWALFPRTLSPKLLPMHEWSRTGGGRHSDFGCAIWLPPPVANARGIPECGNVDPATWGRGIAGSDPVPGSRPFDYASAESWNLTDADVVGSGPFRFVTWVPGVEAALLRDDQYYTGVDPATGDVYDAILPTRIHRPYIGGIDFLRYSNMPLILFALENGEIDYVHGQIPPEFVPDLLSHPEIAVVANAEPGFTHLAYNLRREPWGYRSGNASEDIGYVLRQAIAHTIDKTSIVVNLLQNFGLIGYGPVFPGNTYWYNDNIPKHTYDLIQAMAILDSAQARAVGIGAKPSGVIDTLCDQYTPSQCRSLPRIGNQSFVILAPTADYDPVQAAAAAMIASAMRQVGLNAVARPSAFGTIITRTAAHDFDLYILDWGLDTMDPDFLFDLFHSSNAGPGQNYAGFNNGTFDGAIEASRAEPDRATRRGFIFGAQQTVAEARPYDVLYYRTRIEAYRQDHFVNWTLSMGTLWNGWSLLGIHPPVTYAINVTTSPPGLQIVVGGTTQTAPVAITCHPGESIAVDAPSPQVVGDTRYTFASWSDGGLPSHEIPCMANMTVTATFSVEHLMTVQTVPAGLRITVDGVNSSAPWIQWCPAAATIDVEAPSPQTTGDTRRVFVSWSDGGSPRHAVSCASPATITATFGTEFRITVESNPAGAALAVNGTAATPDGFWCVQGGKAPIAAQQEASIGGKAYRFSRWSDGGAREHDVECTAPARITATFVEVPFLEQHGWALGGIVALVVASAVILALMWRRRRKRPPP